MGLMVVACLGACDGTLSMGEHGRNLKVTAELSTDELHPGEELVVKLSAENLSADESLDEVEVLLPVATAILMRDASKDETTDDLGGHGPLFDDATDIFVWDIDTLPPGATATHAVTLRASEVQGVVAYNGVLAFARNERGSLLDNGMLFATQVVEKGLPLQKPQVDLRLTASGPESAVVPGRPFTVRLFLENRSKDSPANAVNLIGCIDPKAEMAGDPSNRNRQTAEKRLFRWHLRQIPPGDHAFIDVKLRTKSLRGKQASRLFTSAVLTAGEPDPVLADNWVVLATEVAP